MQQNLNLIGKIDGNLLKIIGGKSIYRKNIMAKLREKINTYYRRAVSADLTVFDILAKPNDFIEVSEWHNGDGYDITINERHFLLTDGELKAINHLVSILEVASNTDFKKEEE